MSSRRYNDQTPDVLIASITGNLRAIPHPGDHRLVDWQTEDLLRPSLAQTKLAPIETSLVGRKIGELFGADMAALDRDLREALDLT